NNEPVSTIPRLSDARRQMELIEEDKDIYEINDKSDNNEEISKKVDSVHTPRRAKRRMNTMTRKEIEEKAASMSRRHSDSRHKENSDEENAENTNEDSIDEDGIVSNGVQGEEENVVRGEEEYVHSDEDEESDASI